MHYRQLHFKSLELYGSESHVYRDYEYSHNGESDVAFSVDGYMHLTQ